MDPNVPDPGKAESSPEERKGQADGPDSTAESKEADAHEKYMKNLAAINPYKISKYEQMLEKERKFWGQQPVINKGVGSKVGPINAENDLEKVRKTPLGLPKDFEWCDLNLENPVVLDELYTLLSENYVEDSAGCFRFDYSRQFLKWCLTPPHQFPDWIVGIRWASKNKLMACITGVPVTVVLGEAKVKMVEINFLCVHKSLRQKRIAPVLISEITRRVHMKNMWQAIYTSGTILPTPFTQARYHHRSLNPKKLIDIKFSSLSSKMTMAMTIKLYKLPEDTSQPFRPMAKKDVGQVTAALNKSFAGCKVYFRFSEDEVRHFMLPRPGIMYSYVLENEGKVTDFFSFYSLPSHVLNHPKHNHLEAAYSYYNFASSMSLVELTRNALIVALREGFDVYNCLQIMENPSFLKELNFSEGGGFLNYYLYNWNLGQPILPRSLGMVLF